MLVNEEGNALASYSCSSFFLSLSCSLLYFFFLLSLFPFAFFFVLEKNSTHARLIELDAYVMYAYVYMYAC